MQFKTLLAALTATNVEFVIIGGLAATLHGSARVTYDLDIVYNRTPGNLSKLVAALSPYQPYLRGAPEGLPFKFDVETLKRGLNFTFTTSVGPIDLLGELSGIGGYEAVRARANTATMFDRTYLFIDLEGLIASKKAAGRPKDLETIASVTPSRRLQFATRFYERHSRQPPRRSGFGTRTLAVQLTPRTLGGQNPNRGRSIVRYVVTIASSVGLSDVANFGQM
jgi:hypothetical protein